MKLINKNGVEEFEFTAAEKEAAEEARQIIKSRCEKCGVSLDDSKIYWWIAGSIRHNGPDKTIDDAKHLSLIGRRPQKSTNRGYA